ncbi:Adenylate cyclase related protein [Leptospira biflexa serovar Patoc strain 'Patoc 1 (Ames)']|uniref:Putative adenylate cyclase putative membrane protein n=1 Tax=Leptospira biflexa serovar Patoc (strain Patoc 1 / ATCC 23582 / Paris) TaxID=456481 RepID=B0SQX4_LEPBP|nr:adenylate/guanylate cyclase domain-containing protein [Leptospira biflexa]ABZ95661.1 Adenylate cyclase related protein [Leptospira biflexa serovar Patoc strain 'Patoc 1 (Ames)']ABZ99371.1 Putative adenylate cyclase; putative membrane protein [Leptospira biflexa serovar Patoc strain 'Patoc 1 (Paris)']
MATKSEQILREKEIQGIKFSLYGKMIVFSLLTIGTFFVAQTLFELFTIASISLALNIVLYIFSKFLKKGKYVSFVGLFCVAIDLVIITVLPFIWYNAVGGESQVPRTYLIKTYVHFIIAGTLVINAFSIQPIYPMMYALGVVISQAGILVYAQQDPRFVSTENFKEAIIGPAAHVNNYIMSMGIIGVLGFFLAYLTYRVRRTVLMAVTNEVKMTQLTRYFSPNVVEEMDQADEDFFKPGGKESTVAVLFCDIANFTQISETLGPAKTMSLLSEYHSFMLDIVFQNHGTLDKFIGDGMMVTFGTPTASKEDATNSVKAGIAMLQALAEWNKKRETNEEKAISIRIGIHYGPVIVGNVGIEKRLEYTVIGDTVNAASRLETLGKELKRNFLISKELYDHISQELKQSLKMKTMGTLSLRGKTKTTEILAIEVPS